MTKAGGIHSAFVDDKSSYNSSFCDWKIEKEKGALVLHLSWEKPGVFQHWRLFFRGTSLVWEMAYSCDSDISLNMLKFGLAISPQYQRFFCGRQEADFPEKFTLWQDMVLEDERAELLGAMRTTAMPAIALKNKDSLCCVIQNSDLEGSLRILQISLPQEALKEKTLRLTTELNITEEGAFIEAYIKKQQEQFKRQQEEEKQRLIQERTLVSGKMRLFVDLENKALRLYYKDRELTENKGLYTAMYIEGTEEWICPSRAFWQGEKISFNEMALTLHYEYLSLLQTLVFTYKKENNLDICIDIELSKPLTIVNKDIILECSAAYNKWLTKYEQGDFSVNQYINDIVPIRLKDNKLSQIILDSDTGGDLPRLFFQSVGYPGKQILHIYKRKDSNKEYHCLNSSVIILVKERVVSLGRHAYFRGSFSVGKHIELVKESSPKSMCNVHWGSLRLIFDEGKGRIFRGQNELTVGLGMYTSVRSKGIWYDSCQAVWEIKNASKHKITVAGDWPCVTISQTWQIELINENTIVWMVEMDAHEELSLEIEQANIMLFPAYRNWEIPGIAKGELSDEFTQDYDILPFRSWYGMLKEGKGISMTSDTLPSVDFVCNLKDNAIRGLVENTDNFYKARLIQYQRTNTKASTGKCRYFQGVIKIGP